MKMYWNLAVVCYISAMLVGVAYAQSQGDDLLSAKVDEAVRAQMAEQKIPGVSLAVMRDGKIVKATGYGLANLELKVPVTPDSVFHTESVGKTFTAVGALILVEEGKIGLDEKIARFFPESLTVWKDVTVRQLLTHTSGIPDYVGEFGGKSLIDLQRNYTEDEVVRIIAGQPLDFQPGEKRVYSNSGYVILGALIRRLTGKNWADFLQEHIFKPLGMNSTRVISESEIIPNRTSGYHLVDGQWKNTDWIAPSLNTLADGTLYTNVIDMAKWDEALSSEKILKKTTLDQMWIPIKLNSGKIFPQGLCFRIDDVNGHRLAWKDGEFQGYTTIMSRYLDDRLTVVVLTNLGEDAAIPRRIADRVAAIYIPGLNIAGDKANAHVEAPSVSTRKNDVSTLDGVIDASLKALSGPVGVPRDWDRYQNLFDPAARLVSTSTNDKGETVITRWNLESYKADADDYLVKTGFDDRKLTCLPTRFGNVATVRCGFEGLEQTKVVERGVAMFQLYNDGKRWWITSVVWDRETPGNPIPPELLLNK